MPRQARLDAPGLMHHVMARGLNRQKIFLEISDYNDFLKRIALAHLRSPQEIHSWALMPNHVHFLIRSGPSGISPFFRRLFTGYALSFNARHHRSGYLFQGRYKSLVCDEEEYFLALTRYIHLNPIAAGLVRSIDALQKYPYTGFSALMGTHDRPWQNVDEVLGRFGKTAGPGRRCYSKYLMDGVVFAKGQPTDLLGGGLMDAVRQTARREEDRELSDSRILGEGDFVERTLKATEDQDTKRADAKRRGIDVRRLALLISAKQGIDVRQLFERGRQAPVSQAKAILIYAGVEYLGKSTQEMARLTRMTSASAGRARERGAQQLGGDIESIFSK